MADDAPLFVRKTDEELREAGWDPDWIDAEFEAEGCPYVPCRDPDAGEECFRCSARAGGWTVLDLSDAASIGTTWNGENGQEEAADTAKMLNLAWLHGLNHGRSTAS